MIKLTKSLKKWLQDNHEDKIWLIMLGHIELMTEEMKEQYILWCATEEGRSYLKGGRNYEED